MASEQTVWDDPELYPTSTWIVGSSGWDEMPPPPEWDGPLASVYAVDIDGTLMWVANTLSPEAAAAIVAARAAALNEAAFIASTGI